MKLEAQVKLLEKQKAFLERQAFVADKKAILFDMMIDLAEKEYHIDIRKNSVLEHEWDYLCESFMKHLKNRSSNVFPYRFFIED